MKKITVLFLILIFPATSFAELVFWHKIVGGVSIAREKKDNPQTENGQDGNPIWRVEVADPRPAYDYKLQKRPEKIVTIEPSRVYISWLVVDKTQAEIDAETVARKNNILNDLLVNDRGFKAVLILIRQMLNEQRSDNGLPPLSALDFRALLRGNL